MAKSMAVLSGVVLAVPFLAGTTAPQGPDDAYLRDVLEETLAQRVDAIDGQGTDASGAPLSVSPRFATDQDAAVRELAAVWDRTVASGDPALVDGSVEVSDIETSQLSDGRVKVTSAELVRFDFADKETATDFTAEQYSRESVFVLLDGSWKLDETRVRADVRPYLSTDDEFRVQDPT